MYSTPAGISPTAVGRGRAPTVLAAVVLTAVVLAMDVVLAIEVVLAIVDL